jgi:hypothetical protein
MKRKVYTYKPAKDAASEQPQAATQPPTRPAAKRPAPDRLTAARAQYVRARQCAYFDSVLQRRGPDLACDEAVSCLRGVVEWLADVAGTRPAYELVQACADALASEQMAER